MNILAPAKVNLILDVVGKRPNGYHDLYMIMQAIEIYDKISITQADTIQVRCNNADIPNGESNLAYKAAAAFFEKSKIHGGADIFIEKYIPSGAGLGGGSSDAAAVLNALNRLYGAGLSAEELQEAALSVGSDVPFFINGGVQIAQGLGEQLTPISSRLDCTYLVIKPDFSISTKWAYQRLNLGTVINRPNHETAVQAVQAGDLPLLATAMANVLESAVTDVYPAIEDYKNALIEHGASAALMSGSGSAVFGLFANKEQAQKCAEKLKTGNEQIFLTKGVVR